MSYNTIIKKTFYSIIIDFSNYNLSCTKCLSNILRFSQIDNNVIFNSNILDKYSKDQFFYLPNQFWVHKNHLTVFKAVKILLEKNININENQFKLPPLN